jgi:hypothetical protein
MGEVVQIRDYRRKEEKEAELVRLAKQVMGLIPGPYDTSPSEYVAPESDPA